MLWFGDADETTAINARLLQSHRWFDGRAASPSHSRAPERGPSLLTFAGQGNPGTPFEDPAIGENEGASLSNPSLTPATAGGYAEALAALPHPVVALPLNDTGHRRVSPMLGWPCSAPRLPRVTFSQIGDSSGYHTDLDRPDRVSRQPSRQR